MAATTPDAGMIQSSAKRNDHQPSRQPNGASASRHSATLAVATEATATTVGSVGLAGRMRTQFWTRAKVASFARCVNL
jgi:hypothetical protein